LLLVEVAATEVTLKDAVASYLFNSQLVTLPSGKMALVVPQECRDTMPIWAYLQELVEDHDLLERIEVVDLRQSMKNGGGPACLRLRIVLTEDEIASISGSTLFDDYLCRRLHAWVDQHYRDQLHEDDLADPCLLEESRAALDELTQILRLGSVYSFQR
jgi:succinylarginine dihydrolase